MAPSDVALTTKVESGTPYQLDAKQTLKASRALLKHMQTSEKSKTESSGKRHLFVDTGDASDGEDENETPIWLQLTTKKHIVDKKRLKPAKIALPFPINTSSTTTILLITGDAQRTYKDLIASPAFPADLRSRITRVIDNKKLKAKYGQYEAQRQLRDGHDLVLADDRIITLLPSLLGKTFYKSTAKRPIPISMQAPAARNSDGKRLPRLNKIKDAAKTKEVITPQKLAAEINKTIACALVALSPSVTTSVRVARAGWSAEMVAANVEFVTNELIEKFVPGKWRGVRGLHIKGPETAALPIWLADELWVSEADVLDETEAAAIAANVGKKRKAIEGPVEEGGEKKRKAIEAPPMEEGEKKKKRKKVKVEALPQSNDANLDKEIALRKEKLKKQKELAAESINVDVPTISKPKKAKKSKADAAEA